MSEQRDENEEITLPDGSVLPPGYVPGDIDTPAPEPTPPPNGQTWEEYEDWSEG